RGFDPAAWLQEARHDPEVAKQVAYVRTVPARSAQYHKTSRPLSPLLEERLKAEDIEQLYSHQAFAYDAAMEGDDLMVVTGTNSGKSLCYHLPALERVLAEPAARALYLFPTKALAQDQASKLEALAPSPHVRIGVYDGDTPVGQRSPIRRLAHVVITNPDMLHVGILPAHEKWSAFLKALRVVVIDEMHAYRGVFGSHVGGVIRRLLRLCEWHHNRPAIIGCSATVSNPEELFLKLTGRKAVVIDRDGSPAGAKSIVFWNPPELPSGDRLSGNLVTAELLAALVAGGIRTLAFNRARVSAELVLRYARETLGKSGGPVNAVESYRAGYTPKERRAIERAIFKGDLLGLSATNAMELGVDIGGLDAVVLNGYPGTVSSFRQQLGRAGRGARNGLGIMVAHPDPLEQYIVKHPGEILDREPEAVALNPQNAQILAKQLACAAYERPLSPTDAAAFGDGALEVAEELDRAGELQFGAGRFLYPSHEAPASSVNIRGGGGEAVRLLVNDLELGTMERWRAMTAAHAGAIYLHRGASYLVEELNLGESTAFLRPQEAEYFTQSIVQSVLHQNIELRSSGSGEENVSLAGVTVTDVVSGFRRKALDGETVLSIEELDLPPNSYDSLAARFDFRESEERSPLAQIGAIHGAEHALLAVAPLYAGCDRGDLGSAWYLAFPDTVRPAVFVFDRAPGGVGLCEALYERRQEWIQAALDLLRDCECGDGCPSCLLSSRCEANNENLDKAATVRLLERLKVMLQ
ncbi:MAG TPA: DEAD/DEAH box helicase, partial [Fimbriimonadaceae bacterium]|nr:DEAD/DEAH box helicase [Fimbriimonadaceae bacterium]